MTVPGSDEARADRRVVIIALLVMVGLVVFGVGFGSLFAATNCRQVRPIALPSDDVRSGAPATGLEARALLIEAGVGADALAAAEALHGTISFTVRVPLETPLRVGPSRDGVVVTGDGAVLVASDGKVVAGVTFRRPVTVVGDGDALYALVVGNTITGQVDALRPLIADGEGLVAGTCVDTSAVGSPLSFLHDARDGNMVGLRTDEDGTDAVLELRDPTRGRVWAPVVDLPRAPAGLQGARTSAAIGPDTIVMVRRIGVLLDDPTSDDPGHAVQVFGRADGTLRWALSPAEARAMLPPELATVPTLRMEVAHVDGDRALVTVAPDVAAGGLLPHPVHGPLGRLDPPDPRTFTIEFALADGDVIAVLPGASPVGRDGPMRGELRDRFRASGLMVDDALTEGEGVWLLVGRVLARLG